MGSWDPVESYYESEMERWEETKDDPTGAFVDNLRFGLTGPAPSIDPDGSIDYGPEPYDTVNRAAAEDELGDYLGDEDGSDWGKVKLAVGVAAVLVVLAVLAPYAELGAEVLG